SSSCAIHFTDMAPTELYTLSLHDALPICNACREGQSQRKDDRECCHGGPADIGGMAVHVRGLHGCCLAVAHRCAAGSSPRALTRSEEHTSELQSRENLVCRLLLEKKKK